MCVLWGTAAEKLRLNLELVSTFMLAIFHRLKGLIVTDTGDVEFRPERGLLTPPDCPKCRMPSHYTNSILDVAHDKLVKIYRCFDCEEEIWE